MYLALSELRRAPRAHRAEPGELQPTPAHAFELRVFSQNGEDGVLAEILRRVGAPARYFVEFGVESGREGNCVYLADVAGWRGLFMEADEEHVPSCCERKYAAAQDACTTVRARVTPRNVEELFAQAGVPEEPDVVSIDVDGQDYWIWEAIESYRPRVVIVEYNSAIDPRRRLVQPNDPDRVGRDRLLRRLARGPACSGSARVTALSTPTCRSQRLLRPGRSRRRRSRSPAMSPCGGRRTTTSAGSAIRRPRRWALPRPRSRRLVSTDGTTSRA